LTACWM